jgi:hypothetical protein
MDNTITAIDSYLWEALSLTTPSPSDRVSCPLCRKAGEPRNGGAEKFRKPPGVFCEYLHGVGRFRCRGCKRETVIVQPRALERPLETRVSEAHRFIRYEDDLTGEKVLDPSYQAWCMHCGNVLSTYLFGLARFLCGDCRWQGVIARNSTSFIMSYFTVVPPAPEWKWKEHKHVSWNAPDGILRLIPFTPGAPTRDSSGGGT